MPQLSFFETPKTEGRLVFELTVPGRLPSWNEILGMEQWARYQYKKQLADIFLSALRRAASDYSMKTICARNTWLTYAATLERYLAMRQEQRRLRPARRRSSPGLKRKSRSKSSKSKLPF